MIVVGNISGIQRYIFDVPEAGGGQARRLRARSFLIQALAECAAVRVLDEFAWPINEAHYLFQGAGNFILRGNGDSNRLRRLRHELNQNLLQEAAGEIRLFLGVGEGGNDVENFLQAQHQLQAVKCSPWRPLVDWQPRDLILPSLKTPCQLCRRAAGEIPEADPDTAEQRLVCQSCAANSKIGRILPSVHALLLTKRSEGDFRWCQINGKLIPKNITPSFAECTAAVAEIRFTAKATQNGGQEPVGRLSRRLMTRVPVDSTGAPIWFTELAAQAQGDKLLAVLKADVDSLGVHVQQYLREQSTLTPYLRFADVLDAFFTEQLPTEIARHPQWNSTIYTVFAGGDDLIMIGPWNVMLDFAGCLRELFQTRFPELTLSAGIALFKPKRPIKTAVEQAEELLVQAKHPPKDQCAALGQVWNWRDHAGILVQAKQLVTWIERGEMQRGWLHTLLEFAAARQGLTSPDRKPDLLATARLAYHVNRNYRRNTAPRAWAEELVRKFDDHSLPDVQYLPAIIRYALTATRSPRD